MDMMIVLFSLTASCSLNNSSSWRALVLSRPEVGSWKKYGNSSFSEFFTPSYIPIDQSYNSAGMPQELFNYNYLSEESRRW